MNIVFIGPFGLQPKATMSIRAVPLAKALAARGHTVTVLIPPWDDPARAGQTWTEDGIQVINVSLPGGLWRLPLLFHLRLTWNLIAQALGLWPDVIHFFKPKAYAGLAHWSLWQRRRLTGLAIQLVVDTDDWEQGWNGLLPYSWVQKKFFIWQEQWGLHHADVITVASRALEGLVSAQTGRPAANIFYLPNGYHNRPTDIEPGRASQPTQATEKPLSLPWPDRPPTILLYSRFWEFRLERIVTLVKLVAQDLPTARWLMIGEGLQGEEKVLQSQLAQARLADYVHFTGWLPANALSAYFEAADVAIYPYDDTWLNRTKCSVKLISLLAAGLPVVADAVGQNSEYIESGVSGLLTPPEDDAAMAQAVITLLQQPDIRRQLGRAAVQAIRDKFSWSKLAEIAERAYAVPLE